MARLDSGAPKRDGQVRLPDARRSEDEDILGLSDVAASGELLHQPRVDIQRDFIRMLEAQLSANRSDSESVSESDDAVRSS